MIDSKFLFNLKSKKEVLLSFLFFIFCSHVCWAQDNSSPNVEKFSVFGQKDSLPTRPGSSHLVNQEDLNQFQYNDIHQVLRMVPGVNIQEEDGFGLRPNIGLRGGNPHRSKKVVLLEDGVLIAPAPYSAPAAYYFPQMDKLAGIEVFKGVPATKFGPNSMGGAINMVTRSNPEGLGLGLFAGPFGLKKYDLSMGLEAFGNWSIDGTRYESTGFKDLQAQNNTGFVRHNFTLRYDNDFEKLNQFLTFKFNYSNETSNETYVGLADRDFNVSPFRRYESTQLDKMNWNHRQVFASYGLNPLEGMLTQLTIYHHGFDRSWDKLNGFAKTNPNNPAPNLDLILNDPLSTPYNYFYQVLRGEADSGALNDNRDVLDMGYNQRRYLSQGVQLKVEYELAGTEQSHLFGLSYRLHNDHINRFHESHFFNMISGQMLESDTLDSQITALNKGEALANTMALSYEWTTDRWLVNAITRIEDIQYKKTDRLASTDLSSNESFLAPGLGAFYQFSNHWGVLAGVNKAFTPQGPGQLSFIKPEEAINYELGLRKTGLLGMELIGFYSDYSNFLGTCSLSAGCEASQLGQSFNGGEASVYGAEALLNSSFKMGDIQFSVKWNLTYTHTQFDNTMVSGLAEWGAGTISKGDPVPYIPDWQSNLILGLDWKRLQTYFNFNYLGKMADQAVLDGRKYIDPRLIIGWSLHYQLNSFLKLQMRVDNITDEQYAVSRRPVGLRPGKPRIYLIGAQIDFH